MFVRAIDAVFAGNAKSVPWAGLNMLGGFRG
jgi:hypothetical protein